MREAGKNKAGKQGGHAAGGEEIRLTVMCCRGAHRTLREPVEKEAREVYMCFSSK